MFNSKIIFRADGNVSIGLGHIYRCLAMAERLESYFESCFAIQNPSLSLKGIVSSHCRIISLKETNDYKTEAIELLDILEKENASIIVLDGYNFNTEYQQTLKRGKINLVCIDDCQNYSYAADAIINHADGVVEGTISRINPNAKVYLGFKYALLRQPFIDLRKRPREVNSLTNLFICFGGSDQGNLCLKVLKSALETNLFQQINVVAGNSNDLYDFSYLTQSYLTKISVYRNLSAEDMIKLMVSSELAIVPASTIAMECKAAGMVLMTGITADNQQNILKGLASLKNVSNIGDFVAISQSQLVEEIKVFVKRFEGYKYVPEFLSEEPLLEIFQ